MGEWADHRRQQRLEVTPEGAVVLRLRRPWSDGTRALRFEPSEFLEKLAAMIPKPRINLLIYHGVFGPAAVPGSKGEPGANTGPRPPPPSAAAAS